jgi:tryptophanyl-tRNA synthetase
MGDTFVLPTSKIAEETMYVLGTDGHKMSKSRNNFLTLFLPEKELKKQVMSILSDSKGLEEPKDPDTCHIFALYALLASTDQVAEMRAKYVAGNFGYGHAKTALLELILTKYAAERSRYDYLMANKHELDALLEKGAEKARKVATDVLQRVRHKVGY